jgi:hypothetical protein
MTVDAQPAAPSDACVMPPRRLLVLGAVVAALLPLASACAPLPRAAPCFTVKSDSELRAKDAHKTLEDLAQHIRLAPEDEALRFPKTPADLRAIVRRDVVYLFPNAAAFARSLNTLEGRFAEAYLELAMGESQLVASQVLTTQTAWVGNDLRVARASLASEQGEPSTDRGRMLQQLIRVVEEGNKISDALGAVAPAHLTRGAELIRGLRAEAAADLRTLALTAEYHRLRGEWPEFEAAMKAAEASDRTSPALCYLRGMEQLERLRRPEQGARDLRACLARFPRFVRAQAALVLMAKSPRVALRELDRLKQMNQDHYLVMLLEPTLAADQELARMQGEEAVDATP